MLHCVCTTQHHNINPVVMGRITPGSLSWMHDKPFSSEHPNLHLLNLGQNGVVLEILLQGL